MTRKAQIGMTLGAMALTLLSNEALAAETLGEALGRIQGGNFESLMKFVTGGLFVVGIVFIGTAALNLKKMGQGQAGAGGISFRSPVLNLLAGIFLIYLTVFAGIGGQTVFNNSGSNSTFQGDTSID